MRQTSAILWNSINLLRKKNLKAGSSFCGELSWALSSKGGGSCHLLQAGKQAYWENIKVIKDQMLGNRGAKFFCGFSRVLAVLELIISGGLHSTDCPALCAQTPAQDACLDENMCVVFLTCPGRKERGCAVVSISKGQDCAGHFRLHHPQLWDAAWDLHCRAECGIHTAPGWAKDCQALLKNHGSFFPAFCINT